MTGNNMPSPWTDELRAKVKQLWATHSATEIANVLKEDGHAFTRNSIIGLLHRLNLTIEEKLAVRVRTKARRAAEPKRVRVSNPTGGKGHPRIFRTIQAVQRLSCVEIIPRNLSVIELEPNDCRHPYGGYDDPITFCGHPKMAGSSYCVPHFYENTEESKPRRASYFQVAA